MTTQSQDLNELGRYKFGWSDQNDAGANARRGLNEDVVRNISELKSEPQWMLDLRLKGLSLFERKPMPNWGSDLSGIDFDNIKYFVRSTEKQATSWDELPADIKNTYDRLGIPEAEKQRLIAGVAAQYECLAGETVIWTANRGHVLIKEIEAGDQVFAFNEVAGAFEVAPVKSAAQTGIKQTFEIKVGGRQIRATSNHPFLVLADVRKPGRQRARYERMWRTVAELQVGDLVAVPRGIPDSGASYLLPAGASHARAQGIAARLTNSDLLWLFGLFLGDGSLQDAGRTQRIQFAIPESDPEVRAEISRIMSEEFGLQTLAPDEFRVVVNSVALVSWFKDLGLSGKAHTKRVPDWVFSLPQSQRLAFLGGWVDADGYIRPDNSGSVVLTSVNRVMMEQAAALAHTCGLPTAGPWSWTQELIGKPGEGTLAYRLGISGDFERLDCRNPKRTDRFGRRKYSHSAKGAHGTTFRKHCTDHLGFARVTSIEEGWDEPVYDIEVDGPHNFIAEGMVVHNSEVVYHQIREDLEQQGVLFLDTDTALREHEDVFREYFCSVIPVGDNKFAALNTAVWSGGSFIYVPPGVKVDIPLQAYFRINTENMGQFERTLIIADEGSSVHYVEGCLPAGEPIAMADGSWKAIEEIRVGDRVLTDTGYSRRVNATQIRDFNGDLHTLTPVSPANKVSVTSEHPVLIVARDEVLAKRAPRGDWLPEVDSALLKAHEPVWTPAKDVKVGDFMVYPVPRFEPAQVRLAPAFAQLLGYYLAEGHALLTNGCESVSFSFHIDETTYVEHVQELLKDLYDVSCSVRYDEDKHEARVLVYSKAAYFALREHGGVGSADKRLSADVMGQGRDFLAEVLESYVAGDGNITERSGAAWTRVHTISHTLAMQVQAIVAHVQGTFATVSLDRPGGPGEVLGRSVVRQDLWRVQWTSYSNGPRVVRSTGSYFLVPVRAHEVSNYAKPVFNIDVEEPDSYLSRGFAVHNCTAPVYSSDSLHSAVVEIIVKKNAHVRYTTIQNWSNNVYNLVTKRTAVHAGGRMEWIDGNIGSKVTMKYPACYLLGEHAYGETLSVAFAGEGQHQDAGAKMVHHAPNTSSQIISKSVARGGGRTSYRGLVQIDEGATGSKATVKCDALLVDDISRSDTYPYVDVREDDVSIGHEASVSKVGADQLFYLMSRGMKEDEAMAMIVRGFVEPIARELPMEYALELNRLIELQMEGSVG